MIILFTYILSCLTHLNQCGAKFYHYYVIYWQWILTCFLIQFLPTYVVNSNMKTKKILDRHYVCRFHDPCLDIMPTFMKKKQSPLLFSFHVFFLCVFFLLHLFSDYLTSASARVSSRQLASAHVSLLLNLVLPLLTILFH